MKPIHFDEVTIVITKDQSEYLPLPAHRYLDESGTVVFCWKMTWAERLKALITGKIWQESMTFGGALQPQRLDVDKPFMRSHR